jgi:hypothetical protein
MFLKAIKPFLLFYFIVNGLIASAQTDSLLQAQMKFDLGLVRDKNRHLWPLVYKHKTQDYKDLQLLFTIYRNYQSYNNPSRHNHILPFYWYDSNAAIKDVRIGTLFYPNLFRIISDTSNQSKSYRFLELAPEISLLNVTKSKTGLLTQNNFFFFIWGKNDVLNQKSNFLVFPIYWYYNNRYRTSNTLFPIYKYVKIKDVKEQKFTFYPALYFYKKDNQVVRHSLGLVFYTKKYDQGMARKTVLFPILFSNFNSEFKKFTLIPLVHYDKVKSTNKLNLGITPLFWHQSTNYSNRNVLFPIYWQKSETYSNDSSRRTFLAPIYYSSVTTLWKKKYFIPLVWFDRTLNDTSLKVIPLFYSSKNYTNNYHTLLPFYFYKNNYLTQTKTVAITPLYWQNKAENYSNYWLIPFWNRVSFITKTDTFFKQNFYPLVYYKSNKNANRLTVFPLFYQSRDNQNLSNNTFIFPNYISVTDTLSKFKTILPLYYYNKTKEATNHALLPVWFYKKTFEADDTTKSNLILPIFYGYKSKKESTTLLLPIYYKNKYHYQIWNEKTIALFPIYFRNKVERRSSTLGITPLYWSYYKSDSTLKIFENYHTLFPIWWQKSVTKHNFTTKSNTILPVYFSKTVGRYKHQVLFPIIWKYQDTTYLNSYKSLTIFPFYQSYKLADNSYKLNAYTPLVWKIKSTNEKQLVVFPLVWTNTKKLFYDTVKNTVVFPIYWRHISRFYNNTTLFPLYWNLNNDKRKALTILPIYFKKYDLVTQTKSLVIAPIYFSKNDSNQSAKVVFPLWYYFKNDSVQSKTLFPFWWYKNSTVDGLKTKSNNIIPIYFSKTEGTYKHQVLFPIVWKYKDSTYKNLTIFPIYHSYKLADNSYKLTAYTPLVWKLKSANENKLILFPVVWNFKNITANDTLKNSILFPFYWDYKSKKEHNTTIFPLYWSYKNKERKALTIFPLVYLITITKDSVTTKYSNVLPLYFKTKNSNYTNVSVLPFFYKKTNLVTHTKSLVVAPVYFSKKDSNKSYHVVFPLWYHFKNDSMQTKTLFPFWWYKNATVNGIKTKSNDIIPIYFSKTEETYKHKVWFPLVWKYQDTNYKSLTVFPLYQNYKLTDGSYQLKAYTPLVWKTTRTNGNALTIFPIYFSKKDSNQNSKVLFPLVWKYQDTNYKSLTVFPLYQNYKLADGNYQLKAYTPLVWKTTQTNGNALTVFPIYFSKKDSNQNSKVLFPLVWTSRKDTSKDTLKNLVVFPIYWKYKSKANNLTRLNVLPFYYSLKDKNKNNKVVLPLWWSYKNKFDTTQLFIALYLKHIDNKGTRTTGITPLYWQVKTKNYTRNTLFPIWWSKTNLTNSTNILLPLWYYKTDTNGSHKTVGITPLYWYHKNNSYVTNTLYPIWFTTKDSNYYSNFLFPLFNYQKKSDLVKLHIYPFIYSSTTPKLKYFLLFPLYYNETKRELGQTNKLTMLTPLIWITKDSSHNLDYSWRVLPLFTHKYFKDDNYSKTSNSLFPLYFNVVKRDSNTITNKEHILFPIVWSFTSTNSKWFTFVPLMYYNKNQTSRNLAITPLFWSINNAKKQQNLLWPLYNYNRFKDSSNTSFNIAYVLFRYQKTNKVKAWNIAWPLVQRIKGDNYSYFHAAPIVWYKKSDSMNYLSIQPLFFSQKTNEYKRFQLLWQLYSYRKTFNIKTTHSFLWRTFYNTKYTNGDYENRLLYKLYVNNKKDSITEKTLLPLYNIEKQKNGDYYKGYFLSIYQKTKTQIPNTNHYYLEEKIFWFLRLRSNFNYLKQKGIVTDRKSLVQK